MIEKFFECRTITLSNGLVCFELEKVVCNDYVDLLVFHLTHYACEDPKNIFIDEHKYFEKINDLDNYFNLKISELNVLGYK